MELEDWNRTTGAWLPVRDMLASPYIHEIALQTHPLDLCDYLLGSVSDFGGLTLGSSKILGEAYFSLKWFRVAYPVSGGEISGNIVTTVAAGPSAGLRHHENRPNTFELTSLCLVANFHVIYTI